MTEPVVIGIGATKFIKDATTKMITLSASGSSRGTYSMHDDSNADYQVPVGKKLVILQICSVGGVYKTTGGSSVNEVSSTISHSATTNVTGTIFYTNRSIISYYNGFHFNSNGIEKAETYIEIPASRYVVVTNSTSTYQYGHQYVITGVECDV